MRILLTGASGFVASSLIPLLLKNGDEVFALSRKPLEENDKSLIHIKHDFKCPELPKELPERIDVVVHMAASYLHRDFPDSAKDLFQVNLASTSQLLDYAYTARASQFVLASTGSVYSRQQHSRLCELACVQPTDYFPATKYAAELLANAYSKHMNICIFRIFFPYGPGQDDRLIPSIIDRVNNGVPIEIQGNKNGIELSPIYVDDLTQIIQAAVIDQWKGTYNLASPEVISIREIAQFSADMLSKTVKFNERGGNSPQHFIADLKRLTEKLGDKQFVEFKQGLSRILALENG